MTLFGDVELYLTERILKAYEHKTPWVNRMKLGDSLSDFIIWYAKDIYELRDPAKGTAGGFVYKRKQNSKGEEVGGIVPHITLKSIAQNEPPAEEILVDRPEMVSGVVRVSGPFVVKGTIPPPMEIEEPETIKTTEAHTDYSGDHIIRKLEAIKKKGLFPVQILKRNLKEVK
jgi:hypothetical protein